MVQQIEAILSMLFPVQLPQIYGIVIERKRTDHSPQYPPLVNEDEVVKGSLRVGQPKVHYRNAIERVRAEEFEQEMVGALKEVLS